MTDQVRSGDDGQLEIERTWDGEPLWSVETQQDELFAGDAFQQMPGQLPIEEEPHWVDRIYENRRQDRAEARGWYLIRCSCCRQDFYTDPADRENYCPSCMELGR